MIFFIIKTNRGNHSRRYSDICLRLCAILTLALSDLNILSSFEILG